MLSIATPPADGPQRTTAALQPLWHAMLVLLAVCIVCQGLAISARRALGPGHFHLHPPAVSAWQGEAAAHRHDASNRRSDAALPFGGRLRSHAGFHSETEHHHHASAITGVVTVSEGDLTSPLQPWAVVVRAALDLPGLLMPAGPRPGSTAPGAWAVAGAEAFGSHSAAPPLRPPKH